MGATCVMWLSIACASEARVQTAESPRSSAVANGVPRRTRRVRGGRSNASALMGLIQNTIEPDSWSPAVGAGQFGTGSLAGGGGGAGARSLRLTGLIQETIEPDSWDVNGGNGTIMTFP